MIFLLLVSSLSFAATDVATSMVPRGKVIETYGRQYVVKTLAGTKVDIEFSLDGKFQEAFGKNLNKGDELEPGEGLLSLGSVAKNLREKGYKAEGYWSIEKDEKSGWIYEFESVVMNAKTGDIIKVNPVKTADY
jgi:hypothetical protein